MNLDVARSLRDGPGLLAGQRNILGIGVAALEWDEAIEVLERRIAEGRFTKVGFLNAHIANVACTHAGFAAVMDDFIVLPDGVGVDLAAKLLYGAPFPANLNGTDFVPAFLAAHRRPLRVGLLGATHKNAEDAVRELQRLTPQHDVFLVHDGYFDAAGEERILGRLEEMRPDVLLVAMGVPRQEFWIARSLTERHCTMAFAVGALLDFLSGAVPRAPAWVRALRLEWLFRLWVEPGRLWRRYILGNPVFLARILRQKLTVAVAR